MAEINFEKSINNVLLNVDRLNSGNLESGRIQNDGDSVTFADTLKESIEKVNMLQLEADQAIVDFATEENPDIHNTMIAIQKADVSFKVMMEVRNKILQAYEEVMRMRM